MRGALVIAALASLAAGTARAHADDGFDAAAQAASRMHAVDTLVWSVIATCDHGTDVEQRQCRLLRDGERKALTDHPVLVDADPAMLELGKWDAAKKAITISIPGCVRCTGVEVNGTNYFVIAAGTPHVVGGTLRGQPIAATTHAFADEVSAAAWAKLAASARVQLLVRVPAKPRWGDGTHQAIAVDVVGYRAYLPCDGTVIASKPPSSSVAPDKHACAKAVAPPVVTHDGPALPDSLTAEDIRNAMHPVVVAAKACFAKLAKAGNAVLHVSIAADGSVVKYQQTGDFANTPTAECIDQAVANIHMPATTQSITTFSFPLHLP